MLDKSNFWSSICALIWFCPQILFNFGECSKNPKKKKKKIAVPIYRTQAQAIKIFSSEIRQQQVKQVASFLLPFIKL
ncbi:hypothetical protein L6252_00950 [Candidatus Parcubacteria bacterium]|nr:hypothetical protein [Candidatus Parcubacteria bacterium]